jgi:hypothetical protein
MLRCAPAKYGAWRLEPAALENNMMIASHRCTLAVGVLVRAQRLLAVAQREVSEQGLLGRRIGEQNNRGSGHREAAESRTAHW